MSEQEGQLAKQSANRESLLRPEDLLLFRAVGCSLPRALIAGVLVLNVLNKPEGWYTTLDLHAALQGKLNQLPERQRTTITTRHLELFRYATHLIPFGYVESNETPDMDRTKIDDAVRATIDYEKRRRMIAVLGHILRFTLDNPDLAPEKLFTEAATNPLEPDSALVRITLERALLSRYRIASERGDILTITQKTVSDDTGIALDNVYFHFNSLEKDLGLITAFPDNGYRLAEREFTEREKKLAGYITLRRAQEAEIAVGRDAKRYFSVKDLRPFVPTGYNPENLSTWLQHMQSNGLTQYRDPGTFTMDEDQYSTLQRALVTVDGSIHPTEEFLSNGEIFAQQIFNNPVSINALWDLGRQVATGRGREQFRVQATDSLESIVQQHPGLTFGEIFALFKIRILNGQLDQRLKFYSNNSLRRFLRELRVAGKLTERAAYPSGPKQWFEPTISEETAPQVIEELIHQPDTPLSPVDTEPLPPIEETVEPISDQEIDTLAGVDVTNPLTMFFRELQLPEHDQLSREEQIRRLRHLKQQSDAGEDITELVNDLVNRNLRLVVAIARRYEFAGRAVGLDLMDLIQEGIVPLRRAIIAFDTTRGNEFSSFAIEVLRKDIIKTINHAKDMPISGYMLDRFRRLEQAGFDPRNIDPNDTGTIARIQQALQYTRGDGTISPAVSFNSAQETAFLFTQRGTTVVRASTSIGEEEVLADTFAAPPLTEVSRQRAYVQEIIRAKLSRVEIFVLENRFGLNEEAREMTLEEIGGLFAGFKGRAVTRENVRQIEARALKKLREDEEFRRLFAE